MNEATAVRESAYAAIDRAMATAYETGFRVAEQQRDTGVMSRVGEEMHSICDKLMIFQKTLGTLDPRYAYLGEIIGEFQAALGCPWDTP